MDEAKIKTEISELRKKADEMRYMASGLKYEHQRSLAIELTSKARDFEYLISELELKLIRL